jgi:hypothetical protein
MQITEKELIEIINEEIKDMIENDDIDEGVLDRMKAGAAGLGSGLKSKVAGAFGADTTDIDATQALKKAASLMKSYDKQLLKLSQSLKMDAVKMGIEDQTAKVQQAINQTRRQVASIARDAPTSARQQRQDQTRDQRMMQQRQQQQGQQQQAAPAQQQAAPAQQQQRQAATPAATPTAAPAATPTSAPAATPTSAPAATPAAAPAATPAATPAAAPAASTGRGGRQLSQDPRNVRRRANAKAKRDAKAADRAKKDKRNARDRARRAAARQAASARPAAAANSAVNESKVKKGETLNEQLQEISRRWGFDK